MKFKAIKAENALKKPNMDLLDANEKSHLLQHNDTENQMVSWCLFFYFFRSMSNVSIKV